MLLLREAMNFLNIAYATSHWKYHTFEGYYIRSFSKLRHKVHQNVWKCSLTFPLRDGIVTFYENRTNTMLQSINHGGGPPGYPRYLKYNFWMAWAIITIHTPKCAQMDPQQLHVLQTSQFYSRCKKCDIKNLMGWLTPPTRLGIPKVNA